MRLSSAPRRAARRRAPRSTVRVASAQQRRRRARRCGRPSTSATPRASRHDRHPRLDARHAAQRRPDVHALHACSTGRSDGAWKPLTTRRRLGLGVARPRHVGVAPVGLQLPGAPAEGTVQPARARARSEWRRGGRVVRHGARAHRRRVTARRRAPIRATGRAASASSRREQPRVVRDDAVDPERLEAARSCAASSTVHT